MLNFLCTIVEKERAPRAALHVFVRDPFHAPTL